MPENIKRTVELISNSTERLEWSIARPESKARTQFLKREAWVHFKRTVELLWALYRTKTRKGKGTK